MAGCNHRWPFLPINFKWDGRSDNRQPCGGPLMPFAERSGEGGQEKDEAAAHAKNPVSECNYPANPQRGKLRTWPVRPFGIHSFELQGPGRSLAHVAPATAYQEGALIRQFPFFPRGSYLPITRRCFSAIQRMLRDRAVASECRSDQSTWWWRLMLLAAKMGGPFWRRGSAARTENDLNWLL